MGCRVASRSESLAIRMLGCPAALGPVPRLFNHDGAVWPDPHRQRPLEDTERIKSSLITSENEESAGVRSGSWRGLASMSAQPQKAEMPSALRHFGDGPHPDQCGATKTAVVVSRSLHQRARVASAKFRGRAPLQSRG